MRVPSRPPSYFKAVSCRLPNPWPLRPPQPSRPPARLHGFHPASRFCRFLSSSSKGVCYSCCGYLEMERGRPYMRNPPPQPLTHGDNSSFRQHPWPAVHSAVLGILRRQEHPGTGTAITSMSPCAIRYQRP